MPKNTPKYGLDRLVTVMFASFIDAFSLITVGLECFEVEREPQIV